jgi:acyl-CoA dehydrogenase
MMTFMAENSCYRLTAGTDNVPAEAGNAMICRRDGYGGLTAATALKARHPTGRRNKNMSRTAHLRVPFFEAQHRAFADELDQWAHDAVDDVEGGAAAHTDVDATCVRWVRALGASGYLRHCVPAGFGAAHDVLQSRDLVIARETLARHSGLADFAFTMQGLGSGPISLAGSDELKNRYLPRVAEGAAVAAFALTEPEAGSDVAALSTSAQRDGGHYLLDGEKTFISNGGIADFYVVFARTGEAPGARGISAFVVEAGTAGFEAAERIEVVAPHPLARLRFDSCRIPASQRIGAPGEGFKIAMRTLDIFRAGVAAAALGFARRALDEALARAKSRKMFGQTLADFQLTQAALADMALEIDAAALLTYRAAWLRDVEGVATTREAAMAKMAATEGAQRVIDRAVQMFGGLGVGVGSVVERLYREIRPLRIYEGATEVQKLIIGRDLLKERN